MGFLSNPRKATKSFLSNPAKAIANDLSKILPPQNAASQQTPQPMRNNNFMKVSEGFQKRSPNGFTIAKLPL